MYSGSLTLAKVRKRRSNHIPNGKRGIKGPGPIIKTPRPHPRTSDSLGEEHDSHGLLVCGL